MDGGLVKGWGADWMTVPHTPSLCYSFVNQEVLPTLNECLVVTLQTRNKHLCETAHLKDVQISEMPTRPLGRHSNCLHLSAPCCVSMKLTYTPAWAPTLSSRPRAHVIKTSVGTNLIPSVCCLSYPDVRKHTMTPNSQRSECQTAGKPRKCETLFCYICSADIGRVLFNCFAKWCQLLSSW